VSLANKAPAPVQPSDVGARVVWRFATELEAGMKLSARNQLTATVTSINEGAAIANVEIDVNGQRLVASITVEAARELGLKEGAQVTAIVKASDVILATAD
jgi:molybdate transport system regulatory protein